jgi:steroid delta-isomerase-like uncharacterized protein
MGSAEEQNKQVVRQYIEAFNRQDIERLGQLVLSTNHSFQFSGMRSSMDWNRTKQFYAAFWSAFPDLSAKIEEMVAEGDKVAIPVINTGTHKGEFQGIPSTGKNVSFGGRDFLTQRWQDRRAAGERRHDGINAADWSDTYTTITCYWYYYL